MCILSLTAKHQNVCVTYWKWTDAAIHAVGAHSQHKDMGGTRGRMNLPVSVIRQWAVESVRPTLEDYHVLAIGGNFLVSYKKSDR